MKQKIVGAQIKIAFDWRCRSWGTMLAWRYCGMFGFGPILIWLNWIRDHDR